MGLLKCVLKAELFGKFLDNFGGVKEFFLANKGILRLKVSERCKVCFLGCLFLMGLYLFIYLFILLVKKVLQNEKLYDCVG